MHDSLKELQRKTAERPALEAKLDELLNQKREYDLEVGDLRRVLRREQRDVERLEGRSLFYYFFACAGSLDERLDRERREAYAAELKLDAAQRQLAEIEADVQRIRDRLSEAVAAEAQFRDGLVRKRAALRTGHTPASEQLLDMEAQLAALEARKQELREAINAGIGARRTAGQILSELDSADGWNTWDILGGGGIINHMVKHQHLDEAQELVSELQSRLRRFKTELADIRITVNLQISIDGFLRFADCFFDGFFTDWAIADRIDRSKSAVTDIRDQIDTVLNQLKELEADTDRRIDRRRKKLEAFLVQA